LREGLDLPEVSLVAILDADKEGFLRSHRSLIQTFGRAARNVSGKVIMYADTITQSMQKAMEETERRRKKQMEFNKEHNIIPRSISKKKSNVLYDIYHQNIDAEQFCVAESAAGYNLSSEEIEEKIKNLEKQMRALAKDLEFERAAKVRDEIFKLKEILLKG
jgi:excinuclease ABC subunit B